jgi:TolB-like protein/cytochrome c-type biogenesis protein CcmH/NrfG
VTAIYKFDRFELNPARRQLLVENQPASLGARAFDVLFALIERRERLVAKDELIDLVWPGLVVEENNLQVQVSALRKVLGPDAIVTVPGRGYQFTLQVEEVAPSQDAAPSAKPTAPTTAEVPSIAVLPFVNISDDAANEYFADGLSEQLISVLSKIRGLRVAAHSSAFTFKGKAVTVAAVGEALDVATVLEGSVRKSGNRLRIAVQLVHVATDRHLWSETYDRTLDDILAVQDEIAQSVLMELRTTLLGEAADAKAGNEATAQVAAAVKGRGTNPEAYRLFLQARYFFDRHTREDWAKGIAYLKEALALEPDFALGWAALGRAYANQANWGWVPFGESFELAREAVARARALEPDLPEGHTAMAVIQMLDNWDLSGAERSCRRALELMPGNASVLRQVSWLATWTGRHEEAIGFARRAVEQDPLSAWAYVILGIALRMAGRFEEAVTALRMSLELTPQRSSTHASLSFCLLDLGRVDEALAEAMQEPEEAWRVHALAIIHQSAGRRAESDEALGQLASKHGQICAFNVAEVYAMRGENDLAFKWLERARLQRDSSVVETKVSPFLRSLHGDRRWGPFLRKIGLAD